MNRIIREHYPVSKLPADLRDELGNAHSATVIVEPDAPGEEARPTLREILARAQRLRAEGKIKPVTTEEAVARVRALRDEWD